MRAARGHGSVFRSIDFPLDIAGDYLTKYLILSAGHSHTPDPECNAASTSYSIFYIPLLRASGTTSYLTFK